MKTSKTMIVAGVVGYYLIAGAALVEFGSVRRLPVAIAEEQYQAGHSELQKDAANLARDTKRLSRDLRAGASEVTVAKDRSFVRQDLLNIQLDRIEPVLQSRDIDRDQDLPSLIGESFAKPVHEYMDVAPRR